MSLFEDIPKLLTGDLSREEIRVLRQAGTRVIWRGWLVYFSAMAFGFLGFLGISGFVRADDVDKKIQPLSTAIAQLATAVKQQADASTEQTLALLRVAITDGLVKKCHATKDETKEIYRAQVNEAQARYYHLTGQYYPEHSCADL